MHYKPILYSVLVASLAVPTVGSRAIPVNSAERGLLQPCVEDSQPLEERVGDTNYIMIKEGNPQKVIYFIPNVHWQGDIQRDEQAMQSLIESNRVDALMFEGLEYTGKPEPMENVEINLNSNLVQAIKKRNIPVFGSEGYGTYKKRLSVAKAYFMNDIIGSYPKYLSDIIKLEQQGSIKEHSSNNFKKRFSSVIDDYHKEIQQFKKDHPPQDFSKESSYNLLESQREVDVLDSLRLVSKGFRRIAVLFGADHIPKFVNPLCNSEYTIFVAQQEDDISENKARELIRAGETSLPKDLEMIFQVKLQMDYYLFEARKEAGLK